MIIRTRTNKRMVRCIVSLFFLAATTFQSEAAASASEKEKQQQKQRRSSQALSQSWPLQRLNNGFGASEGDIRNIESTRLRGSATGSMKQQRELEFSRDSMDLASLLDDSDTIDDDTSLTRVAIPDTLDRREKRNSAIGFDDNGKKNGPKSSLLTEKTYETVVPVVGESEKNGNQGILEDNEHKNENATLEALSSVHAPHASGPEKKGGNRPLLDRPLQNHIGNYSNQELLYGSGIYQTTNQTTLQNSEEILQTGNTSVLQTLIGSTRNNGTVLSAGTDDNGKVVITKDELSDIVEVAGSGIKDDEDDNVGTRDEKIKSSQSDETLQGAESIKIDKQKTTKTAASARPPPTSKNNAERPPDILGAGDPDLDISLSGLGNFDSKKNVEDFSLNKDINLFVVNGWDAAVNRFGYMTYLYIQENSVGRRCGGTLIAPDLILCAAHCLPKKRLDSISFAEIGSFDRKGDAGENSETINLSGDYYQFGYEERLGLPFHDVAIFKLAECSRKTPVSLRCPNGGWEKENQKKTAVIGWGRQSFDSDKDQKLGAGKKLQEVDLYVDSQCNAWGPYVDGEKQICAHKDGAGPCFGDSGGPLIVKGGNEQQDCQIGIVSFGSRCADADDGQPQYPYVFARVSAYMDWITKIIRSRSKCMNGSHNRHQKRNCDDCESGIDEEKFSDDNENPYDYQRRDYYDENNRGRS